MKFEGIDDDDVVISGIGCELPQTESLPEFAEKLLQGINLVTKDEKKSSRVFVETLPEYSGKIKNINKFDNTFFGVSQILCLSMDPMTRHILERTFEAVVDAGINPADIKGTNTAVYSSTSFSEFDLAWLTDNLGGYGLMGRNRCFNANRVSFWLDVNGSSSSIDGSFANGILNLANGYEAVKKGRCDIALVNTANFQSIPEAAIQIDDLYGLSSDGVCKSYDDSANGLIRSDAVVVFVLQRARDAKRCYAVIADVLARNYGCTEGAIHKPTQTNWEMLLNEFYARSKINVNDVHYVEGQGKGVKDEDAVELNAINNVFCKNRKDPLLVGSVSTNIGFAEPAAAACGILKAIVAFEKGVIPKNLHYKNPNSLSRGLIDGRIKIVDENTPIPSDKYIAINAHGLGGVYAHLVLKANPKINKPKFDGIPRLMLLSARTDEFMDETLDKVEALANDVEFISMLQDFHYKHIDKYLARGYTIVPKVNDVSIREHQAYGREKHPVWFIFSGMGSQWTKMGKRLMDLPLFRDSIEKSHKILLNKGLDLINIITTEDPKIYDNILHSFVGIAAIQIALVDILNVLGIVPDKMIGHSVGELGCSYADGCLTAEQTILCAYSRGKASIETELIKGFMAAIGKGYNQIKDELPEGIEVACHNAADSCTLSGPADLVKKYVEELQARKIFARTVNVSNIAYHSQYIKPAAPKLLQYLQEVIPEPKLRSSKWISTSNLEKDWDTDLAKYCSAEYHTNNLLSSVYFEEGSKHIPEDAVCIEIAPHGLLQAILKRSLNEKCLNIPLTNRSAEDPINYLLQAFGKMYLAGLDPQVHKLYPKLEYPVSRNTPSLHQLVHWQHDNDLRLFQYSSETKTRYSLRDQYLKTARDGIGYIINDKNYYPSSVFLQLVWVFFASSLRRKLNECPVMFKNVRIEKPVVVQDSETDDVDIYVGMGSGRFEVVSDHVIAKGDIYLLDEKKDEEIPESKFSDSSSKNEIYTEFNRRGYHVGNDLKCLEFIEAKNSGLKGKISLAADWLQTLESIIQLQILEKGENSKSFLIPVSIEQLTIDPKYHLKYRDTLKQLEVEYQSGSNIAKCGGVEMKGLKMQEMSIFDSSLRFESSNFVSFMKPVLRDLWTYVDYCFGIVSDNCGDVEINIIQITNGIRVPPIASYLQKTFSHLKLKAITEIGNIKNVVKHDLVVCDSSALKEAFSLSENNGFVFVKSTGNIEKLLPESIDVISKFSLINEEYTLLKKKEILNKEADYVMIPNNEPMLNNIIKQLENSKRVTYLVGYKEPDGGLENYKKKCGRETLAQIRWVLILDDKAPKFDCKNSFYARQLSKGLATNIYKNNSWGKFHQRLFLENDFDIQSLLPESGGSLLPCSAVIMDLIGVEMKEDSTFGSIVDYSGRLENGVKLMGVATLERNNVIPINLAWDIPENWSMEDAVTVPLSHSLMYYCIQLVGEFQPGENILVTDGLSCNGRAAIAVALALGAQVYVTVNNEEEILELKKSYPSINEKHILNHSPQTFDVEFGLLTKGKNFDIIINNLEDENLLVALKCYREFTRIFHFGEKDLKNNVKLGLQIFLWNISFQVVSPDALNHLTGREKKMMNGFITKAINDGYIKPLPKNVYSLSDVEKLNDARKINENQRKTVLTSEFFKNDSNRLSVNSENSYIIFGDETGLWLDIAKWLVRRNATNIVINCRGGNVKNLSRTMKNYPNITMHQNGDVEKLITEAKKLKPLGGIFFVRMSEPNGLKQFAELDKSYRDVTGHLVVISKRNDSISDVCAARSSQGFPTTNFIWETEEILTNRNLDFIERVSGSEPVIYVSDVKKSLKLTENRSQVLKEILPKTVEDLCKFGSRLESEIKLIELPTLGKRNSEVKSISPLIVIPGLEGNPENVLKPLCKKLIYPCFVAKFPTEGQNSVQELAESLLQKILPTKKSGYAYNILGVSWGSYVAIELTRLIEEKGGNVSLTLINGPLRSLQESFKAHKSLEYDLLKTIQEITISAETSAPDSFLTKVDGIANTLQIPFNEKIHFKEAISYIHHKLQIMIGYDYSNLKLKGPITIFKTGEKFNDSTFLKVCNYMSIRHVEGNHSDIFNNGQIISVIHGSAVDESMSDHTIHFPSWKEFEEFLLQEDLNKKNDKLILEELRKSNKQVQIFGYLSAANSEKFSKEEYHILV